MLTIERKSQLLITTTAHGSAALRLERNHQGLDNRLITTVAVPANENADPAAPIARRERLGGLLSYYYRAMA